MDYASNMTLIWDWGVLPEALLIVGDDALATMMLWTGRRDWVQRELDGRWN